MPAALKHLAKIDKLRKANVSCVLATWTDGLFYAVEVLEFDHKERKCLVKFEDNYQCWMGHKDLHIQFNEPPKDKLILCCMCDDGDSKPPNEIIMCDVCQQGYHIQCHQPPIDRDQAKLGDEEVEWVCQTCTDFLKSASQSSAGSKAHTSPTKSSSSPMSKSARKAPNPKPKLDRKISKSARKAPSLKVRLVKRSETKIIETNQTTESKPEDEENTAATKNPIDTVAKDGDDDSPTMFDGLKLNQEEAQTKDLFPETPVTYTVRPDSSAKDDAVVEEMDPLVIRAAQGLAEVKDISKTGEFVEMITKDKEPPQVKSSIPVHTRNKTDNRSNGSSRRKVTISSVPKTATATEAPAAAAY